MFRRLCVFLLLSLTFLSYSQTTGKQFTVKYIDGFIKTDGLLDEAAWDEAEVAGDFQQYFPTDTLRAEQQTEIRMLYNGSTLYIGITAYAPGKDYVIPSLERDFRAGGNDNISLIFDTFNDGTNAFLFGINPYGVRREALISGGGADLRGFNTSWDVKWQAETTVFDNYYTAEIAIPLTSFKFREGETKWRFQSYRFDMQSNERSVWAEIPQNQLIFNLAFMGDMKFEKPLGKSRTPLALIPYINILADKDYVLENNGVDFKVGGDAKVAIGNGMNLDITINPDFSNVEVDNIVTNLTRFEINLPEKRQFFIDNSDLFSGYGGGRDANPFFSRRIGIARDSAGNTIQNDILAGVRLSGKLNQDWRLGFLNIQTAEDPDNEIASNNNMMLALQRKMFSRSFISMFLINRQSFGDYDFLEREDDYNRVVGVDYNLASRENTWTGKFYAHKSFQPDDSEGNLSLGANLEYNSRNYKVFTDLVKVDEDFRSDLGFIRRTDILKWGAAVERLFWPKAGPINRHSFRLFPIVTWRPGLEYQRTDHDIMTTWRAELRNQSDFEAEFSNRYIFLTDSFDPTGSEDGIPLPGNQGYEFNSFKMEYRSNRANVVSFSIEPEFGGFFNGTRFSLEGEVSLRIQPIASLRFALNYDKIELPDPYPSADLWLFSPKVDITFSKSLFWSTLIQYSNQQDNFGINSRLQWRFAPLSDLFLVYNDNYFVNQFSPRYRSINLKFTYWLNI
ncbi:DUF5916 domain-containing protein [Zeaxanthinibacter enoshimensis]|uniref:DUF5916 domain-containing protein n=1 Tax=Zeaxanthinibacter enoshimensis TaxID=392009 RepID=A0A4R6TQR4_9FLAO|nr:DUF5916 domain-containing protein [Zeaxanthinibacter enoshimensis]TDQ30840.1 hypothetical protein CLV82_1536 [Zeaxanthinibacter enoshimensis]